jgi:GNAT superfamily N-acetyltransferase
MTDMAAGEGESLETGYGSATPEADNALLDYARGEADCFAATARAGGGRIANVAPLGLRLTDLAVASPFGNTAHLTRPIAADETPALAAALHEFFDAVPGGPFLVFLPWPTGDLGEHGFHLVGHPPLMLRAPSVPALATNPKLRVARVETADDLADFERTLVEAYPAPEMQPWTRAAFLHPDILDSSWQFFVGHEDDRCVATAAAWPSGMITIVEQISVRDECRGRGYGTAITAAATHAEPGRPAMLIASDLGRSIYDQLGYVPLLRYTLYIGMRS